MKSDGTLGLSIVEGLTASNALMKLAMDSFCPRSRASRRCRTPGRQSCDDAAPRAAKRHRGGEPCRRFGVDADRTEVARARLCRERARTFDRP